jgi:hypothetical protein
MNKSTNAGRSADVVEILTTDHLDLADTLIAEVMRHAVAEEMFVYPAIEEHVPDGTAQVEHDKHEHQEIVEVMKEIEDLDAASPAFMERVQRLEDQLRHHASDEETEQFPQLRAHIPADKLVSLGDKVQTAKRLAPTRPHPSAPHSELFHKTIGAGVGMIDRLRDALTARQTK